MTHTIKGIEVSAKPGQFIICNVHGRPIRVQNIITSWMTTTYQVLSDGTLAKVA